VRGGGRKRGGLERIRKRGSFPLEKKKGLPMRVEKKKEGVWEGYWKENEEKKGHQEERRYLGLAKKRGDR